MTVEHYKIRGIVSKYIADILNKIKNMVAIPEILKTALLTPVLKKENDPKIPGNYRGIAVTPYSARF